MISSSQRTMGAALQAILLVAFVLALCACGTARAPASSSEPTGAHDAVSSAAGRYRLRPADDEEDYGQAKEDHYLVLQQDGSVQFETETLGSGDISVIARGSWQLDGDGVVIEIAELLGKPVATPEVIRYEYQDGFPIATEYAAGGTLYGLKEAEFTIGAGERHPLVQELHRRLAAIDYLAFSDPGDDLFTEATRKAVVAFQEAQGLLPNGEVNPATWVLLNNPQPPRPTPTPLPPPAAGSTATGVPDVDNLPTHTADNQPILYLTFDDGPGGYTRQVLDLLSQYGGMATFFVLGQTVDAEPDLVRAEVQGGHQLGNHTYSHASLEGISSADFMAEVEGTRQIILTTAGDLFPLGEDVRYLRPPYGAADANTRQYAANLGYTVVLWDIDPQDWRRAGPEVIADHVVGEAYPGAIVLLHDGGGERSQTVAALGMILQRLSGQGYVFRSVSAP
ncbi:MAG: polysaccharide deacetylase family protein [Anaerolineae bacterium]